MASKKQRKQRNKTIQWILAILTAYVLLVNNSLQFLEEFGVSVRPEVVGVIGILATIVWSAWKSSEGEL